MSNVIKFPWKNSKDMDAIIVRLGTALDEMRDQRSKETGETLEQAQLYVYSLLQALITNNTASYDVNTLTMSERLWSNGTKLNSLLWTAWCSFKGSLR